MASARASAASAGFGGASSRRIRVTIAPTWALSARPLPETAALTSLGVCRATGRPRRAAATIAMPLAWAVPITVLTSERAKTRSTATASGAYSSSQASMPFSMVTSRWATGRSAEVRRTLTSTSVSGRPTWPSTTPMPQRVRPGSIPSTRIEGNLPSEHLFGVHAIRVGRPIGVRHASGVELLHDLVGDVEVGVEVLHVVEVLEDVDEPEHLGGGVLVELDLHVGHERRLGGVVVEPGGLQRLAHGDQVGGLGDDLEGLPQVVDRVGARLERGLEDVVLGDLLAVLLHRDDHDALAVEQEGDRPGVGQRTAVAGHGGADLHGGAVLVVGEALDEHGHAGRTVALVHDRLVVGPAGLGARPTLDR